MAIQFPADIMVSTSVDTTQRYQAIVREAERLFGENGYHGTSIADIAGSAGVAQGLINYHFGSKEELLVHVVREKRSVLLEQLNTIKQSDQTAEAKIRAAVKMLLDMAGSGLALTQMVLIGYLETSYNDSVRRILLESLGDQVNGFAELIDDGIAKGEFKSVDSKRTTHLVVGMVFEMIRVAVVGEEILKSDEMTDEITYILMGGIKN